MQKKSTRKIQTKKGAASFYVVAFSTLILVVIAVSFATIVLAEVARTSNADLSQSAYDAALAGVEDAKTAVLKYQNCLKDMNSLNGADVTCADVVYYMEHPDCDMVAHILGRIAKDETGEVMVEESSTNSNELLEAYTCSKIETVLSDYRSSLSASNPSRVVNVQLDDGQSASSISAVRLSWYSDNDGTDYNFTHINNSGEVVFSSLESSAASTPPAISVQLIQTASSFSLGQFDKTQGSRTNRGTVYLIPTDKSSVASTSKAGNYIGSADTSQNRVSGQNVISKNALLDSNSHGENGANLPFAVYCNPDGDSEFVCSTIIELPDPIGGMRSDETFAFVVSLPYGTPDTDFSLDFICNNGASCASQSISTPSGEYQTASVKGIQVSIDSTGRANDLYRRVETRLETTNIYFPYPEYAVQLFGDESDASLIKDIYTTSEYNF